MLTRKDNLQDEQLMKLYQNGDEEAFKILYARHAGKVYGFLKSRLKNSEMAAEVFQEVFIKIHKSKHLYNESLPALAWFFTISRTVMIDELRKNKKNNNIVDNYELEQIPQLSNHISPDLESIVVALAELPSPQKEALEMRYLNDKTFEQIAKTLNVSPSNVRQIISRGIKKLKQLIPAGDKS